MNEDKTKSGSTPETVTNWSPGNDEKVAARAQVANPAKRYVVKKGALDPVILAAARRSAGVPEKQVDEAAVLEAAESAELAAKEARKIADKVGKPARRVVVGGTVVRTPAKFNAQRQEDYLFHLSRNVRRGAAAQLVGVTYDSVVKHRKADPNFMNRELEAEAEASENAEDWLYELAERGHFEAIKLILFNRLPDRWRDPKTIKVEVSGQIDHADDQSRLERVLGALAERAALNAAGQEIEGMIVEEDTGVSTYVVED